MYARYQMFVCILLSQYYFFFQIARRLLGKILIDLRNTREEAINVIEPNGEEQISSIKTSKDETEMKVKPSNKMRISSSTSENSPEQDDDDDDDGDSETKYRLDPKYVFLCFLLLA